MNAVDERPAAGLATRLPGDRRRALWLAVAAFVVFNLNGRLINAGDTYPAQLLPFALWGWGTVFLDPVVDLARHGHPLVTPGGQENAGASGGRVPAYWLVPTLDGHIGSFYPIVTPLIVAPLYAPAAGYLAWRGWSPARITLLAPLMEKLAASAVVAIAVALFYLALRRRIPAPTAAWLAVAFAFGTTAWSVAAQGLWPHGVALLLAVSGLLLQSGPAGVGAAALAGLLCGLLPANRPPDLLLAAGLAGHALFWLRGAPAADLGRRRRYLAYGLAAALPLVATATFNLRHFGTAGGGYIAGGISPGDFFRHPLMGGLAGLLVSPARGWFVYSPFLVFVCLRLWPARLGGARQLSTGAPLLVRFDGFLTLAVCAQLLLYAHSDWRAGWSWGPRFMTDALPFVIWLLAPVHGGLRRLGRATFAACVLLAVAIHWIGAFRYQGRSNLALFANDRGPALDFGPAWHIPASPILVEAAEVSPEKPLFRIVVEGLERLAGRSGGDLVSDDFESGTTAAWSHQVESAASTGR